MKPPRSRVVMVSAGFWPAVGGAERQALELSRALRARGAGVIVLTRRLGESAAREEVHGVPVRRLRVLGTGAVDSFGFMLASFGWLLKHAPEYDAIHAHLAGSPALAAALAGRLLGKPVLVKLGGGRGIGELAASSRTVLGRLKLSVLARLGPKFLAVVPDLAAEAREHMGAGVSIEVLPNGVDTERYKPVSVEEKAALRVKLGWTGTVFVYTGRFSPEKRLPWFAALWSAAVEERDATLVLVGMGPDAPAGEERVRLVPPVDDAAAFYAAADAFVLPSESEGLSNSLLEAMASGLPVIASAVGGTAETVVDGTTGLLFGKDDEITATTQIQRILNDNELRTHLGTGARREVERRYSIARVVERLLELYRGNA